MLGALVGTGIVWGLIRRLELVKLCFNLAQLALAATLAAGMLQLVAGNADALQPETWVGLYAATLVQRRAHDPPARRRDRDRRGQPQRADARPDVRHRRAGHADQRVSIAIAAALVVATDPRAVPVLLVPALTVFAVYRAYISERQRHERLEFLYDANRTLSRSPEVAEALEALLARSLEAFNADVAEVLLFTADGDPLRTTHGPGDHRVTMEPADRAIAEELAGLVDAENPVV